MQLILDHLTENLDKSPNHQGLMKSQPLFTLKEFKKQITQPKGVHTGKQSKNFDEPLPDEGTELYDSDEDDLDKGRVRISVNILSCGQLFAFCYTIIAYHYLSRNSKFEMDHVRVMFIT